MNTFMTGAVAALSITAFAPAMAATATATSDTALRVGPGMDYAVIGTLPASQQADVEGCIAATDWCRLRVGSQTGWAHSTQLSGSPRILRPVSAPSITVTPDEDTTAAELDAAVVSGTLVDAPQEVAPLVEIPEDAVAVYMTRRAGPDTPRDGQGVALGDSEAGVSVHSVPGSDVSYLTIDGKTRVLKPGTQTTVFINR
ncbi:SH3 domain-containing protein [Oceanicola sp. 502str15]|uniref:SH3 domain-containing protein n=1 Tax=Oceanicola sp. 502str15 TaxID=2696061 RepID=UPI0020956B33|nr:SH3 domain-containing protein [Oceanicola sp. 502str15]MCO6381782.1 SH3 domain-containing protein [Oceanicola sp. 502str15]